VSPILVRPVREQLEHDRVIRLLQARFRRRFDAGINPGAEQNAPVGAGASAMYPDVVLTSQQRGRKVEAVIEVETVESVNNLEALAQWVPFGRLRSAFHLYVPAAMADVAKRLCTDFNVPVSEIHSYHWIGDEMRFLSIFKAPTPKEPVSAKPARPASTPKKKAAKPAKRGGSKSGKPAARTARSSKRK
jgi:hypothetical protein